LGRTSDNPLPKDRLKKKFELCTLGTISADAVEKSYQMIDRLESLEDVHSLTKLFKSHS